MLGIDLSHDSYTLYRMDVSGQGTGHHSLWFLCSVQIWNLWTSALIVLIWSPGPPWEYNSRH